MPGPADQLSDLSSFWQQGDWVSDMKQDRVNEAGGAQPVCNLRGPVEALREGRQQPGLQPPVAAASLGSPSQCQVALTPALAAVLSPWASWWGKCSLRRRMKSTGHAQSLCLYCSYCFSCFPSLLPFLSLPMPCLNPYFCIPPSFLSSPPTFKFNLGRKVNYKQV